MDKMLGKEAQDKITGVKGIITGKIEYLYGCNQYCISPKAKEDGTIIDGSWFDEGRIEIIGDGIKPKDVQVEKNGASNDKPKERIKSL